MPSPDLLNFAQLCMPIAGDNPAGKSLREDFSLRSSYQAIKDAQRAARDAERDAKRPPDPDDKWKGSRDLHTRLASCREDWKKVLNTAAKITAEESKDLQIVSWWIEALLRIHGFPGLRDGFRLARELIEAFWDQLYPLPDEEGVATRVLPLALLNGVESDGVLADPIVNLPITAAGSMRAMSLIDSQQANDLERIQDASRRAQRIEDGAITLEAFEKAVAETSTESFVGLLEDITSCAAEFDKLSAVLDEKCGSGNAPPTSNIRNALSGVREQVERFVRGRGALGGEASATTTATVAVAGHAASSNGAGPIGSRDDAFRTLMQVADFFRRTEPQSPIPYLLEQAVRWGKMPLPELLNEMLPADSIPAQSFKLVGIRLPERKE
jgi:type VI secretion system protein ImpA